MTDKPLRRVAWPWLIGCLLLGMIAQEIIQLQQEPRTVQDAWQEGYESGYYDATGEEYQAPNVLLLVLPLVVAVGVVGLILAAVKFKASRKAVEPSGDRVGLMWGGKARCEAIHPLNRATVCTLRLGHDDAHDNGQETWFANQGGG